MDYFVHALSHCAVVLLVLVFGIWYVVINVVTFFSFATAVMIL